MPVKPDSRHANLPIKQTVGPDGTLRSTITLRLGQAEPTEPLTQHRLVQGETLDQLAFRYFGDERLWWRILDANPLVYPLDIPVGQILTIPAPGPATRITRARRF